MLDPEFENIGPVSPSSIRWIHRRRDDLATDHDWHFHPQWELTWFIAGAGTRYAADRVERFDAGEVTLFGPNLPHCWRNDGGGQAEWITVQFTPESLGEGLLRLPEAAALAGLLDRAGTGLVFEGAGGVGSLLADVGRAAGLVRMVRLVEALDHLAGLGGRRVASPAWRQGAGSGRPLVDRLDLVMRYIATHFRGAVSQSDVAAELGMNSAAFAKFMRGAASASFTELVKLTRINEACRLLAHGDRRITDVALDCGYQHSSHFDRHFRQLKGVTPSDYRRRMAALRGASAEKPR